MPPKPKSGKEAAVEGKSLKVSIKCTRPKRSNEFPKDSTLPVSPNSKEVPLRTLVEDIRIRSSSTWANLSSFLPVFGNENGLEWKDNEENNNIKSISCHYTTVLPNLVTENNELLKKFHEDPSLYFFVFSSKRFLENEADYLASIAALNGPPPAANTPPPKEKKDPKKDAKKDPKKSPRVQIQEEPIDTISQEEKLNRSKINEPLKLLVKPKKLEEIPDNNYPLKPIDFFYFDLSSFLTQKNPIKINKQITDEIFMEISVSISEPILAIEKLLNYEPLNINFKSLNYFPYYQHETLKSQALRDVYLYCKLDFKSFSRTCLIHPSILYDLTPVDSIDSTFSASDSINFNSSTTNFNTNTFSMTKVFDNSKVWGEKQIKISDKVKINLNFTFLSNIFNKVYFTEALNSVTFDVELYQNNILKKLFNVSPLLTSEDSTNSTSSNSKDNELKNQLLNLFKNDPEVSSILDVVIAASNYTDPSQVKTSPRGGKDTKKDTKKDAKNDPKKDAKKGAPTAVSTEDKNSIEVTPDFVQIKDWELFLIENIKKELQSASSLQNHSETKFRLDKLLTKSNDLIKKFMIKREKESKDFKEVKIQDDLLCDFFFTRPKVPEKWDLPEEMSLLKALRESKLKASNSAEANLNTISNSTGKNSLNKYELMLKAGTTLSLSINYLRDIDNKVNQYDSSVPPTYEQTKNFLETKVFSKEYKANMESGNLEEDEEVKKLLNEKPYTRLVIIFNYNNKKLLKKINKTINQINLKALPNSQGGSLRNYLLSNAEKKALDDHKLDILTGFMLIDGKNKLKKKRNSFNQNNISSETSSSPSTSGLSNSSFDPTKTFSSLDANTTDMTQKKKRIIILEGFAKPSGAIENFLINIFNKKKYLKLNSDNFKLICNPKILFSQRCYQSFNPTIKIIKLKNSLKNLLTSYSIYNHNQVQYNCYHIFNQLYMLYSLNNLKLTTNYEIFPIEKDLEQIEILYGDSITIEDITGVKKKKRKSDPEEEEEEEEEEEMASDSETDSDSEPESKVINNNNNDKKVTFFDNSVSPSPLQTNVQTSSTYTTTYFPSDCHNPEFEAYLSTRDQNKRDYIKENEEIRKNVYRNMLLKKTEKNNLYDEILRKVFNSSSYKLKMSLNQSLYNRKDKTGEQQLESSLKSTSKPNSATNSTLSLTLNNSNSTLNTLDFNTSLNSSLSQQSNILSMTNNLNSAPKVEDKLPKIYLYSNQSLNFKEMMWNELREQIKNDKSGTYTLSKNFISQNISVINEDEEKINAKMVNKSKNLTPSGFVYPKPKTHKEIYTHEKKPTESRIEDLKESFVDLNEKMRLINNVNKDRHTIELEKGYKTQIKTNEYFGLLKEPEFEKEFDLKKMCVKNELPRGNITQGNWKSSSNIRQSKSQGDNNFDDTFFNSIHVIDNEKKNLLDQDKKNEIEEFNKKIVVDTLDFKVSGFNVKDTPLQIDRYSDILKDEPKKSSLKHLRTMKSSTGKINLNYTTTPLSILNLSEKYVSKSDNDKYLTRNDNKDLFITTTKANDNTLTYGDDFVSYINPQYKKPFVETGISKKKHIPINPHLLPNYSGKE